MFYRSLNGYKIRLSELILKIFEINTYVRITNNHLLQKKIEIKLLRFKNIYFSKIHTSLCNLK